MLATDLSTSPSFMPRRLSRGERIVVADDDGEMRALIRQALVLDGYEVLEARDGVELTRALRAARVDVLAAVDLVVTDVRMPGLDGLAVLDALRRNGVPTPVIVISGFADAPLREVAESLDAVVFAKPFDLDDLRTAVFHILRQRVG
jgi:CheY-like chemotaxis protein